MLVSKGILKGIKIADKSRRISGKTRTPESVGENKDNKRKKEKEKKGLSRAV